MAYRKYTREQFESTMSKISDMYHLAHVYDGTEAIEKESGATIKEHVYVLPTRNPAVCVLIYSSVSRKTGQMRDNGNDAVRLVMRWSTKKGYKYRFLAKHLRIDTLFVNIRKTLVNSTKDVFNLNPQNFSDKIWR